MIGTTVVCLVVATALTLRAADLRGREPLALAWAALVLPAAAALVWNVLYSAALSTEAGPIIPIFHWLFTFVPALLAGWLLTGRTRGDRWAAALGTGVVTRSEERRVG